MCTFVAIVKFPLIIQLSSICAALLLQWRLQATVGLIENIVILNSKFWISFTFQTIVHTLFLLYQCRVMAWLNPYLSLEVQKKKFWFIYQANSHYRRSRHDTMGPPSQSSVGVE